MAEGKKPGRGMFTGWKAKDWTSPETLDRDPHTPREYPTGPMKTTSKYGKRYDQAFQQEAVRLLVQSGRSPESVAQELGISTWSLRRWKDKQLAQAGEVITEEGEKVGAAQLAKELREARKQIEYLTRQREILKKAMSILSAEPTGGMR